MHFDISFTAEIISGEGIGKTLGSSTLNLDLKNVPDELEEGIYAVRASLDKNSFDAVMHYGERPTLKLGRSCEVHILTEHSAFSLPVRQAGIQHSEKIVVNVFGKIRDVRKFADKEELKRQIAEDIEKTKSLLQSAR